MLSIEVPLVCRPLDRHPRATVPLRTSTRTFITVPVPQPQRKERESRSDLHSFQCPTLSGGLRSSVFPGTDPNVSVIYCYDSDGTLDEKEDCRLDLFYHRNDVFGG